MRNIWVTAIIIITWIASTIAILTSNVSILITVILAFLATFFLIELGLQKPKE